MSFIFREIKNKSWWDKSRDELPWLQEGELVADVLKGLGTENGELSTYRVDEELKNVDRVVAAYACTRESLQRVDYVLIPFELANGSFALKETPGETADDKVNRLHVDIIALTPRSLANLAYLIDNCARARVLPKAVGKIVEVGINRGNIDCTKINSKLKEKVCT